MGPDIENYYHIWKFEQNRLTPKYDILNSFVLLVKCSMLLVYIIIRIHSKLPVNIVMYMLNVLPHVEKYFILPSSMWYLTVLVFNLNSMIPTIFLLVVQPCQKSNASITKSKNQWWPQIPRASRYIIQSVLGYMNGCLIG